MLVAVIACLVGLAVVIVALARDEPIVSRTRPGTLPAPTEAPRFGFPLTAPGYDPAAVDAYVDAVAGALADLFATAPPEVTEHARRLGLLWADAGESGAGEPDGAPAQHGAPQARSSTLDGDEPDTALGADGAGANGAGGGDLDPQGFDHQGLDHQGLDSKDDHELRAAAALVVIEARALSPR